MRRALLAILVALGLAHAAPTEAQTEADGRFDLVRATASGGAASPDHALAKSALLEVIADAVISKLYGTPPLVASEDRSIATLAAVVPELQGLVPKIASVQKGVNPFDGSGDEVERALAARCAVEQASNPDDPAASVEQRRRAETALVAARAVGSVVLTADALTWLGLYAIQGGDVLVARRYLSEASSLVDRVGGAYGRMTVRRYLGLTYALDGDLASALRETAIAEQILARHELPLAVLASVGPGLYTEMIDYAVRLGDQKAAVALADRACDLLVVVKAPDDTRAEALERLGQLHARGAADDVAEAKLGAKALAEAAVFWAHASQADRAVVDYTSASVLLVENAEGEGARALLEPAMALSAKQPSLRAGVEFWMGRAFLSEAAREEPRAKRAAYARAIGLFESALKRLETTRDPRFSLRTTVGFWLGRAYLEGPARDTGSAVRALRRAFDASVSSGDANTAILCAEMILRAEPTQALARAEAFYGRLVASTKIDPVNAANALAAELQRESAGVSGVAPNVVTLFDNVDASLSASDPGKAAAIASALAVLAASAGDRALLESRADKVFERLTAANDRSSAQDLCTAVWNAWEDLGDAERAAVWRGRFETLAEESYVAARSAKRFDSALRSASGLLRAARERRDADATARWFGIAASLRREGAESLERSGKLGLALDAWRVLAELDSEMGANVDAQRAYGRAAELAERIDDREGRAEALAHRARAELDLGDPRSALVTSHEAIALAASMTVDDPDTLPAPNTVAYRRPAIVALGVRSAALLALAHDDSGPERERLSELARRAEALADALKGSE